MTSARQPEKPRIVWIFVGIALALAAPAARAGVATTEWVVTDWRTGLAISGFDPVAYFANGAASQGRAQLEYTYAGATWRFRNVGNRAAFVEHPGIYMPRLGGHDPVRAAQGLGVAGNPLFWVITADRLYLFYDGANRAAFAADPDRYIAEAERKWPTILHTLAP